MKRFKQSIRVMLPTHKLVLWRQREPCEVAYLELDTDVDGGYGPAYSSDAEKRGDVEPLWYSSPRGWLREDRPVAWANVKVELVSRSLALVREYEQTEEIACKAARMELERLVRAGARDWQGMRWKAAKDRSELAVETVHLVDVGLVCVVIGAGVNFSGDEEPIWIASRSAAAAIHLALDLRGLLIHRLPLAPPAPKG
jgi:hypothetical protein